MAERKMRQTVDLPEDVHDQFARWKLHAALAAGRNRVTTQDALRAVVEVLVSDEAVSRKVLEHLEKMDDES